MTLLVERASSVWICRRIPSINWSSTFCRYPHGDPVKCHLDFVYSVLQGILLNFLASQVLMDSVCISLPYCFHMLLVLDVVLDRVVPILSIFMSTQKNSQIACDENLAI